MMRRFGAGLMIWMVLACPLTCSGDWHPCAVPLSCPRGPCPEDNCPSGVPAADHSHHAPADHCAGHGCLCAGAVTLRHDVRAMAPEAWGWWASLPEAPLLDSAVQAADDWHRGNLILPGASGRQVRLMLASLLL